MAIKQSFYCPFLQGSIELTEERIRHIRDTHPEMRVMTDEGMIRSIRSTLEEPTLIVHSQKDDEAIVFGRWEPGLYNGKYVIVAVVLSQERNWIITAFISRYRPPGEPLWTHD